MPSSRLEYKSHTLFETNVFKIGTLWGRAHLYSRYKGGPPGRPSVQQICKCLPYQSCINCGEGILLEMKSNVRLFFRAGQSSTSLLSVIYVQELISLTDFVQQLVSELFKHLQTRQRLQANFYPGFRL